MSLDYWLKKFSVAKNKWLAGHFNFLGLGPALLLSAPQTWLTQFIFIEKLTSCGNDILHKWQKSGGPLKYSLNAWSLNSSEAATLKLSNIWNWKIFSHCLKFRQHSGINRNVLNVECLTSLTLVSLDQNKRFRAVGCDICLSHTWPEPEIWLCELLSLNC